MSPAAGNDLVAAMGRFLSQHNEGNVQPLFQEMREELNYALKQIEELNAAVASLKNESSAVVQMKANRDDVQALKDLMACNTRQLEDNIARVDSNARSLKEKATTSELHCLRDAIEAVKSRSLSLEGNVQNTLDVVERSQHERDEKLARLSDTVACKMDCSTFDEKIVKLEQALERQTNEAVLSLQEQLGDTNRSLQQKLSSSHVQELKEGLQMQATATKKLEHELHTKADGLQFQALEKVAVAAQHQAMHLEKNVQDLEYLVQEKVSTTQLDHLRSTVSGFVAKLADVQQAVQDQSLWQTELTRKADKTYVDQELLNKAGELYVNADFDKKRMKAYIDGEMQKKADAAYVSQELDKRPLKEEVANAVMSVLPR